MTTELSGPGSATRVILIRRSIAGLLLLAALAAGCSRQPLITREAAERQGDDLVMQEKYSQAIPSYQAALALAPDDGRLRIKLANAYRNLKQWENGAIQYITAAEKLPDDLDVQIESLNWMLLRGRFYD